MKGRPPSSCRRWCLLTFTCNTSRQECVVGEYKKPEEQVHKQPPKELCHIKITPLRPRGNGRRNKADDIRIKREVDQGRGLKTQTLLMLYKEKKCQ